MTESNLIVEENKKFYLEYLIKENNEINRFFPLYSITIAKNCACNDPDCTTVGKHPKVPFTSNKYRQKMPLKGAQGFATGFGIVVIDCDIKDHVDGWQTLVTLAKPFGGIPDTVTVITGSGGKHLYFRTNKSFKNRVKFADGLDFRSDNGFVVFPESKHISGNKYKFDDDLHPDLIEVAELPQWFEAFLEEKEQLNISNGVSKFSYDPFYISDQEWEAIKEALEYISSNCSRDFWRKIGMCLFNTAREDAFDVWDYWCKQSEHIRKKNKSIYSKKDNIFQWTTQFSYSPANLPLEILEIAKIKVPVKDDMLKQIEEKFLLPVSINEFNDSIETQYNKDKDLDNESNEKYMKEAIELSQGFVRKYYEFTTERSRYSINKLHFLAAFSALSAVAQSAFLSPTRCSLSLYQLGFANTGRGKDDVLYFLKDILSRVSKDLLSNDKYTSINGLLMDLYEFNSRMHISDEVHTYFTPMLKALPSSPLFPITGKIMELWSHRENIDGVKSRSFKIPQIQQPKLSLFTLSSFAGMRAFKDQNAISSGFLNRFLVSIAKETPKVNHEAIREKMPQDMVDFLTEIFDISENKDIRHNEFKIELTENITLRDHQPQRYVKEVMKWENEDAKVYFQDLVERIDDKRENLSSNKLHEEHDMYSRYAEQIIRLASLHALGCDRFTVSLDDLKLAEKMMFNLAIDMLEFLDIDLKETQFSQYKKKIISFFNTKKRKSKNATLREITIALGTKTSIAEETLDEMVSQNILMRQQIVNKNSTLTKVYNLM